MCWKILYLLIFITKWKENYFTDQHQKIITKRIPYVDLILEVSFKGCWMGTLFVLFSPCFRENVVVTCKIGSFLCSLDNSLQKNMFFFVFVLNQISKWRSFEKAIFDLLLTLFSHHGKVTKIPSAHISLILILIHTCILLTLLTFFALPILRKIWIYQVWFLFGMSRGVESYSCHFGTINK